MPNRMQSAIYINNHKLEMDYPQFNGGERNVKVPVDFLKLEHYVPNPHGINIINDIPEFCKIHALLFDSNAVIDLLLTCDAVRRMGIKYIDLTIPYFPAARQDRVMVEGEALSVKVMADLINSIKARSVTIYDPHSDVTPALIDNVNSIFQEELVANLLEFNDNLSVRESFKYPNSFLNYVKDVVVIAPDGGAIKKATKVAKSVVNGSFESAGKVRDVSTGQITGISFKPDKSIDGKIVLIPDDLCDAGNSFYYLAKYIRENHNPEKIGLLVTHGLFVDGVDKLKEYIDNIYTFDYTDPKGLKIIELG